MFSFEGQTRSRPIINLGGGTSHPTASSSSSYSSSAISSEPDSIAKRARIERQHREDQRRLDRTARVIQAFWRSRREAGLARDRVRLDYDLHNAQPYDSLDNVQSIIRDTARLAFIFRHGNKGDLVRLGKWARSLAVGKPSILLFQIFEELKGEEDGLRRWSFLIIRLAEILVRQGAIQPT